MARLNIGDQPPTATPSLRPPRRRSPAAPSG